MGEQEDYNQKLLNIIADFINQPREDNPFSSSGLGDMTGEMFSISDINQEFIIGLIDDLGKVAVVISRNAWLTAVETC